MTGFSARTRAALARLLPVGLEYSIWHNLRTAIIAG